MTSSRGVDFKLANEAGVTKSGKTHWLSGKVGSTCPAKLPFQSLLTAPSFSRSGKWSALAFKTSVQADYWWQGPRDLPARTRLFWTADPNTLHLLEWHVAAILKGDPLLRLWCPPLCPKQASHSLCSLFSIWTEIFLFWKGIFEVKQTKNRFTWFRQLCCAWSKTVETAVKLHCHLLTESIMK